MMIESQMDCTIVGANPHGNYVVSIVTFEKVIGKPNRFPIAGGKFSAGQTDMSVTVIIGNILISITSSNAVLLKCSSINRC